MKNNIKKIALLIILMSIISLFNVKPAFADVGDFETYSSDSFGGSSFSSSSWDSDWGSDSDWDYGGYSSSGSIDIIPIFFGNGGIITFMIIAIIVIFIIYKKGNIKPRRNPYRRPRSVPDKQTVLEETVETLVQNVDPMFNKEEFLSWARDLFIKLQYAWADRDWSAIRCFETNELYEQHSTQLKRYIENKQINKIERVSVNWAKLYKFDIEGDKEHLSILLNSKMIDYIIDETTGEIIQGDNKTNRINTYKLTFVRKKGTLTKPGETTVNTTNCPNCGAPTQITSAGECPYCGSIITTGDFSWVLENLERAQF